MSATRRWNLEQPPSHPNLRDGDGYRRFDWLGLFRFDGGPLGAATLGVLRGGYYEGYGYMVIQFDGDRSRVVARASTGGC